MNTCIYGFDIQTLKNGENAAIPRLHFGFFSFTRYLRFYAYNCHARFFVCCYVSRYGESVTEIVCQ